MSDDDNDKVLRYVAHRNAKTGVKKVSIATVDDCHALGPELRRRLSEILADHDCMPTAAGWRKLALSLSLDLIAEDIEVPPPRRGRQSSWQHWYWIIEMGCLVDCGMTDAAAAKTLAGQWATETKSAFALEQLYRNGATRADEKGAALIKKMRNLVAVGASVEEAAKSISFVPSARTLRNVYCRRAEIGRPQVFAVSDMHRALVQTLRTVASEMEFDHDETRHLPAAELENMSDVERKRSLKRR